MESEDPTQHSEPQFIQKDNPEIVDSEADSTDDDDEKESAKMGDESPPAVSGGAIKPIGKSIVHKICSGQVIVTLATAIKELVENSIDAHATSVDVHLIEYGSLEIIVVDNGVGVDESNFAALTMKHCTSKLAEFEDLSSIGTFGFRGEALSSLCALAELSVTTRTKDAKTGYRLDYDGNGRILSQTPCARAVGTTVILRNIFQPIPVRHREYLKNMKREYYKMVNFLYGYCLISTGVRINCTNEEHKGDGPKQVFSVPALDSVKERLISLFGSKQMTSLLVVSEATIPQEIPVPILQEYGLSQSHFTTRPFRLEGFISKPYNGRSATDRQFLFINSRPFESAKITKIVNEVYHSFSSRNQYPLVLLNIITNQDNVDVNVSPDKRSIYLQNEKLLYSTIKATLADALQSVSCNFDTNLSLEDNDGSSNTSFVFPTAASSSDSQKFRMRNKSSQESGGSHSSSSFSAQFSGTPSSGKLNVRSALAKFRVGSKFGDSQTEKNESARQLGDSTSRSSSQSNLGLGKNLSRFRKANQPKIFDFITSQKTSKLRKVESESVDIVDLDSDGEESETPESESQFTAAESESAEEIHDMSQESGSTLTNCEYFCENGEDSQLDLDAELECNISISKVPDSQPTDEGIGNSDGFTERSEKTPPLSPIMSYSQSQRLAKSPLNGFSGDLIFEDADEEIIVVYDDELESVERPWRAEESNQEVRLNLDLVQLRSKLSKLQKLKSTDTTSNACRARKFRAKLTDNNAAEQELKKELTKEMFKQIDILGQFNHGFIIGKHGADLFIIDQHASDEKYNFESLEKSLVLQTQKLIYAKPLQLPAISENILLDNLDTFRKNGFDFQIDESEKPTNRIQLTSIPYSKAYEFGREDIEELIFMMEDAPEKSFCRPTKVRTMLASRACRKSVMIGTALGMKEMTEIVHHMGDLDQPWNCPHGRPTLRHLFNLNMMPDIDSPIFSPP